MHATEIFGGYAEQYKKQVLPAEVIHHAKRAVIDWHASLYPGLSTAPLAQLEQVLADDLDRGRARLGEGAGAAVLSADVAAARLSHPGQKGLG